MRTRPSLLIATLLLTGCSDMSLATAEDGASYDTGFAGGEDGYQETSVYRFDIYPSSATADLVQQSHILAEDDRLSDLTIRLDPTISISGTVLAFEASPTVDAEVPGRDLVPVIATIRAEVPGTISGGATQTDDQGAWSLILPQREDYVFSIVPTEANLPFHVETDRAFTDGEFIDDELLPYGEPVYGLVRQTDGTAVPAADVRVRLVDPETRLAGPVVDVESSGHYMVRATPGTWLFRVESDESFVPERLSSVSVEEDGGGRVDMDMGIIDPVFVFGSIDTVEGLTAQQNEGLLEDTVVRFTSVELVDTLGTISTETKVNGDGQWAARLVAGSYAVEFVPPYDPDGVVGPLAFDLVVTDETVVEARALPMRQTMSLRVLDPSGFPNPGVQVTAREAGFGGYLYTGLTDSSGQLRLELPPVPMELTLTPPTDSAAISHYELEDAEVWQDGIVELSLREGQLVKGRVLSDEGVVVPYARVDIVDDQDTILGSALTDSTGTFSARIETDR